MAVERYKQNSEPSVLKMLTAKEYNLIRYACAGWTIICGAIEVFCTVRIFSGEIAAISAIFAATSVGLAFLCMRLSKSPHTATAVTAFLIDIILSGIATAVVVTWTFAAVKITGADGLDKEWKDKKSVYAQSVKDAADRLDKAQAKYTGCTENAASGGFRDRSKIALACQMLVVDPAATIFQPTEKDPGPQKTATKLETGHDWESLLLGLGRAGTIASFISIVLLGAVAAIARGRGRVEIVSNEKGNSIPRSNNLDKDKPKEHFPAPSGEVENDEKGTFPNGTEGTPEDGKYTVYPVSPLQNKDTDKVYPVSRAAESPETKRKRIHIANNGYSLTPRLENGKPKGWKVSFGTRLDPNRSYICSATDEEAVAIVGADDQEEAVNALLIKKGKMKQGGLRAVK